MRVLLIDHGCRGDRAPCDHPDAAGLASHGVQVVVAEASGLFPTDAIAVEPDELAAARESARRAIDLAVDREDPEVILVLHAGVIADLAVETGVPVVVHVALIDLEAVGGDGPIRDLVASSLGSADVLAAADTATRRRLVAEGWTSDEDDVRLVPTGDAKKLIAACRRAIDRRHGR